MSILHIVIAFLSGYFIGNFSPAYLLGKLVGQLDVREEGSGNAGATNVMRLIGWRYGALVFVLDMLKGLAASAIGYWLGGYPGLALASLGVLLGHDFPILLDFKGGKGIASTTGIFLGLFPLPTLAALLVFGLVVLSTRMVSAGALVFVNLMMVYTFATDQQALFIMLSVLAAALAVWQHRGNIKRILNGTENKVAIGKKDKQDTQSPA